MLRTSRPSNLLPLSSNKHVSDKFEGKIWCVDDLEPTLDATCDTYKGAAARLGRSRHLQKRYFYATPIIALFAKTWDICVRGSLRLTVETTISFKAVSDTGDFRVESKTRTTRNEYQEPYFRTGGLVSWLFPEGLHTLLNEWASKATHWSRRRKKGSIGGDREAGGPLRQRGGGVEERCEPGEQNCSPRKVAFLI
ncbi:hypothetical protein XPA_009208 [Xanthoria parietina]